MKYNHPPWRLNPSLASAWTLLLIETNGSRAWWVKPRPITGASSPFKEQFIQVKAGLRSPARTWRTWCSAGYVLTEKKLNATDKLNVYEVFPPGIQFLQQRVGWLPGFSSSFFSRSIIKTLLSYVILSSIISGKYRRAVSKLKHCLLCEFYSQPRLRKHFSLTLTGSASLWRKCAKRKRKESTKVGEIVWLKWNEGDWKWHLKWALIFFLLERRRVRTMRAPFFQGGAVFFPAAKRNESTQQKSSQQSSFSTDFLHLTATLITLSGGTCARSADASALLPSWSLFYWAQVHTTFPLSVLCSLSE